jgi:hypothetical protein
LIVFGLWMLLHNIDRLRQSGNTKTCVLIWLGLVCLYLSLYGFFLLSFSYRSFTASIIGFKK